MRSRPAVIENDFNIASLFGPEVPVTRRAASHSRSCNIQITWQQQ
jgi:hypothetical protein